MIKNFTIEELVPPDIFHKRGQKAWQLFDYRALATLQWVRDNFGSCTVNDWLWGGEYEQSGLRTNGVYLQNTNNTLTRSYKLISDSLSQHKYGRAFDCKLADVTAREAREWIKSNWSLLGLPWAITLEEDVGWLHFDVRMREDNLVHTFKP